MSLLKSKFKFEYITQSIRKLAIRHNFYFQIIGSFLVIVFLIYLHFMQPPSIDINLNQIDKLIHLLIFFFTMMWFMYITKKWLLACTSLILLGLMLEWIQMNYIANRSFDWFDWIADIIGTVLCFIILPVLIDKYFDSSV